MDLVRCRKLLITLEDEDLRRRLSDSPWCQSAVTVEESWLREAAMAFDLRTKAGGRWKTRVELVDDVVKAVEKVRKAYELPRQELVIDEEEAEIDALWSALGLYP